MSALEDAALAYALDGLYVFPLQPNGKTPLTAHGLEDATTDPMMIEAWWERWPNANIAIRTGDTVVVDEDRMGAFEEFAAEIHETIPETGIVKTASGRHWYFLQPEGRRVRNTAGRLAPGIDTRGDGGYVVAPPSVHPSGSVYEWMVKHPAITMPDWLAERLIRKQPERTPMPDIQFGGTTPYGQRALEQEIQAVATAAEGTRNHTLNTAAFALGQLAAGGEVDHSDAYRSLEAAAQAAGLPQTESSKTIRSGFTAGMDEPRQAPEGNRMAIDRKTHKLKLVEADGDPIVETEPERDSWLPLNLNDLPAEPPTPPNLGDTHLVYPGKRHVFSGPPESAKTLAAYCILIQIARQGGLGILIDFEMGSYDAHTRLRELGATPREIDRILYVEPDVPASPDRVMHLVDLSPDLVVIDAAAGVYSLEGLDDNKRLDVEKVAALYIKLFWRNKISSILIDHVVKDNESRGRYMIGSERKLGGSDVHLGFDVVTAISRGTVGKYKITTHKDRGGFHKRGYLADMALSSDPVTHNIAWSFTEAVMSTNEEGEKRPDIKMEQISNKLHGREDRLTVNEVKDLVGGSGKHAGEAIATLIKEGHIDAQPGPRGSKLLLLTRPYNRAQDPLLHTDSEGTDSPIPVWFSSDSGTGDKVTDSLVLGALAPEPVKSLSHPPENQSKSGDRFSPEDQGWFDENGNLDERSSEPPDDLEWS